MDDAPVDPETVYPSPAVDKTIVSEPDVNPIRDKSFAFALDIVGISQEMTRNNEYVISKQLMRSGTAVGAIVEEAIGAESRRDFLHKMSMAHKEAREVHYWLRLIDASEILGDRDLTSMLSAAEELIRILVAITRTVKNSPSG